MARGRPTADVPFSLLYLLEGANPDARFIAFDSQLKHVRARAGSA